MSNNVHFGLIGILLIAIAGLGVLSMQGKDMSVFSATNEGEEFPVTTNVATVSTAVSDAKAVPTKPVAPSPKPVLAKPVATQPAPVQVAGTFTMAQVKAHNSATSCYTVVNGTVYDLTPFVRKHPGGSGEILSICGKDGSDAFSDQHGDERRPERELAQLKIGTLAK
jgi:cytochrome b involved in lipid metabolism